AVGGYVCPVSKRARERGDAVLKDTEAVADRETEFLAIHTREGGHDVNRGVRDERGVMVGEQGALLFEEIQQIGHLLEIGRDVRVVASQVNVVELKVDDVLDGMVARSHG